jgi:restriction system protein
VIEMPVPSYQQLLQPLLKILSSDGDEMSKARVVEMLSEEMGLNPEDREARLPSGTGTFLEHNIDWARNHLQMQGLVDGSLERGMRLTAKGWDYAAQYYPDALRRRFSISPHTENREQMDISSRVASPNGSPGSDACTETATLQQLRQLNDQLAHALIARICRQSPSFFETLIIDLLLAIGYGRGQRELAKKLGRSGDEGVDGVVAMDGLGLDLVYFQAKRYKPEIPVPVSAVRDFVGSLDAKRATRGVFFTTSFFPGSVREYANQSTFRVGLVDGCQLAQLMMQHGIGVRTKEEIKIRRIDESYFAA